MLVDSYRVKEKYVLSCSDFWPDGMVFPLDEVLVGDSSGPQRYGRYGVIWGNIRKDLRVTNAEDFSPIIWWVDEQEVVQNITCGPFVEYPRRIGTAASSWDLMQP